MIVHQKVPYSFLLMEEDSEWYLTYFTGGPVEIDICVKLKNEEVQRVLLDKDETKKLVQEFKSNHDLTLERRVIPSKRP